MKRRFFGQKNCHNVNAVKDMPPMQKNVQESKKKTKATEKEMYDNWAKVERQDGEEDGGRVSCVYFYKLFDVTR